MLDKNIGKYLSKGIGIGLTTGLLVTLFDSIFMLLENIYIPFEYPFLLAGFNIFLWVTFGVFSALTIWLVSIRKNNFEEENFFWVLLFLLPFSLICGIFGRFTPGESFVSVHDYYYYLSFLWVFLLLLFSVRHFKNRVLINNKTRLASFVPETITILALFMFCSNLNKFPVLLEIFNFMFSINVMENPLKFFALYRRFLIPFYVVGVVAILYCYYLMIFKIRFSVRRKWANLFLILIVSSCLTAFWQLNYRSFVERNSLSVQSRVIKKHNEIPNVFLIIMDTVRADRLAVYGHPSNGKNLLEISKDFLVFENCISSSSWTQPSHASLFTGLYPVEHGTHKNLASSSAFLTTTSLSEEFTTLAEVFKNNGYQTLGVVSNWPNLNSELKFNKGFQVYDCSKGIGWITSYGFKPIFNFFCYITNTKPKYTLSYRTAEDINANIFHLINNSEPLPFFMFINFMDAHEPHRPPRPFSRRRFSPLLDKIIAYTPFSDENDETFDESFSLRQYDSEICYMDNHLGKFFSQLKKQGIYDSSLIIISSDHGELFGEHGQKGHGVQTRNIHLYEGVVRVPLLIKFPQNKKVVQKQNRIILSDLYSKILTICGLPIPDHISLQSTPHYQPTVVSEFYDDGIGAHRALYDGKYKYMHYAKKQSELYDLERDPGEQENLTEALPEITTLMENKLITWQKGHMPKYSDTSQADTTGSEEVIGGLKSLGYIE